MVNSPLFYVKSSNFEDRMDVNFYNPSYVDSILFLKGIKDKVRFEEIIDSVTNGVEVREYVLEGIPYIRVSDLKRGHISSKKIRKIPSDTEMLKRIMLKEGDLLISRSGSVGIASVVTKKWEGAIISSHVIKIRLKEGINQKYIEIIFNSDIGKNQIKRVSTGALVR